MLLTAAITGVYFANNIAVTWILLETTTLCAAGIIYHRHSKATLEATWKYLFVCSTGIAIAYLGILLLCATASNNSLSYADLQHLIINGNPLYLKAAFLLILTGYSCKMEIFPLYTIGVDANFAAPAPASAMISTGLVNAGFLAIFRIYRLFSTTDVFPWVKNVMLIIGLLSLVVGALFLRRTNNYKRFLSYSTVENMGIVAIGLGIGGLGVWAALFHVVCHTFIKSSLFLQIAIVRQIYNGYRINRIGDYININKVGAIGLLLGMIAVLAFPPSPLFISELMIMMEALTLKGWWVVAIMVLLICIVIFTICYRMIKLCYQSNQDELHLSNINRRLSYSALSLLILALIIGFWQPAILRDIIDKIAMF
jgi:hydrogenase-4 component F